MSKNDRVPDFPDDHSGIIAGFNKSIRVLKRILWVGVFVALVLILTLSARSAS